MNPDQLAVLSNFLNHQAGLPAEVQAIADELKASLTPAPVEEVVPPAEEEAPTE